MCLIRKGAYFILLCLLLNIGVDSKLIKRPEDTEAVIGSKVIFVCHTLDPYSVNWEHTPVGSKYPNDVYISYTIVRPYDERLEINRPSNGLYQLIIPSVRVADAGRYECIDAAGQGERQGAELIVLESEPECQISENFMGIIGVNDCGIEPDDIEFRCNLRYYGNLVPELIWHQTGGKPAVFESLTTDHFSDHVTVSAVVHPRLENNGFSLICETSISKHSWMSPKINIHYVLNTTRVIKIAGRTNVVCSANSSQPCQYEWIKIDTTGQSIHSNSSIWIDKPGSYRCYAKCQLKQQLCTVQPLIVEFPVEETSIIRTKYDPIVEKLIPLGIVVVVTVIFVVVVFVIVCIIKCHRPNRKKMKRRPESTPLLNPSQPYHRPVDKAVQCPKRKHSL